MTVLKDGKGTSTLAQVNNENQLMSRSVIELDSIHYNHKYKTYYAASLGALTANSINEHRVLYLKCDDTVNKMYVDANIFGWNGGNTNHNRACRVRVYKDAGAPTLNYTTLTLGNLNWTSNNVALVTAYKWDGTATDGMVMSSPGTLIYDNILTQGLTPLHLQGIPILGYGNTYSFSYTPEEIGTFALVVRFFLKNDVQYD